MPWLLIAALGAGYLLGSIPTGWLAGHWLAGLDIRSQGSGSTGATNVLRVLGKGPALAVFLVDVLKGTAAVLLARYLLETGLGGAAGTLNSGLAIPGLAIPGLADPGLVDWAVVAAGLAALAGHIWPIWLGGKGGKAVATGLGMLLGLAWPVGLASFGVFLAVLSLSRVVSLSSVMAALALPLLMAAWSAPTGLRPAYMALAVLTTLLVVWRHRANLQRLWAGTEPRLGQKGQ
ncbi:MAG: glycerol-3-phosphate 1-O-acyltransferase PlsY [Cyanobium sp. 49614_E6]|nr:glycerol-3-phosphate 1-O-acyltransferase PlsY [Cyanobium sp. 49614_E6]